MSLIAKIFGKWFSSDEETVDVTDLTFGSIVKFRVGSTVSISTAFTYMLPEELALVQHVKNMDLSSLIVDTILSFDHDGIKIFRLYCRNPDCIVQVQEEAHGKVSYMVFFLTQDIALQDKEMYNEWVNAEDAIMKAESISDEQMTGEEITFDKVFGPLQYTEILEADASGVDREPSLRKSMTLFDRNVEGGVEYMLFDAELDNWVVEGFLGVDIPSDAIFDSDEESVLEAASFFSLCNSCASSCLAVSLPLWVMRFLVDRTALAVATLLNGLKSLNPSVPLESLTSTSDASSDGHRATEGWASLSVSFNTIQEQCNLHFLGASQSLQSKCRSPALIFF